MSIPDMIRANHQLDSVTGCTCGEGHRAGKGWWTRHIATVTEQAARAAELDEAADELEAMIGGSGPGNRNTAYGAAALDLVRQLRERAARIRIRGGASQ